MSVKKGEEEGCCAAGPTELAGPLRGRRESEEERWAAPAGLLVGPSGSEEERGAGRSVGQKGEEGRNEPVSVFPFKIPFLFFPVIN
jgi:hypothetical protein